MKKYIITIRLKYLQKKEIEKEFDYREIRRVYARQNQTVVRGSNGIMSDFY